MVFYHKKVLVFIYSQIKDYIPMKCRLLIRSESDSSIFKFPTRAEMKESHTSYKAKLSSNYQLLHQYHKILHKANICGIDAITVLSYGLKFLSQYTMILWRDHRHMSRDKIFLSQNLWHHTATFVFRYEG